MDPAVEAELERGGAERRGHLVASGTGLVVRLAQVARAHWPLRRCSRIGRWTRVMFGRPIVDNRGRIELGSRVRLMSEFAPVELRTAPSGRLVIGERTGINYGTSFHVVDSVQIGANVDFGPHCIV